MSAESELVKVDEDVKTLTDIWNCREFVRQYGENIRWVKKFGGWFYWDGKLWRKDDTEYVERSAKDMMCRLTLSQSRAIANHARKCQSLSKISSMIELAKSEPGISMQPEDFDRGLFLLNCNNGTIDLTTGDILPHSRLNFITRIVNADYDPQAKAPTWEWFLNDIFMGNNELVEFVNRSIGYSLTGSTKEQCFFILYGKGNNGKGTMLNTLMNLLGEYADAPTADTFFLKKNESGNSNDIAALKGKRYVVASESNKERSINEALIKRLTGEDLVRARFLFQEYFTFEATFKIFLMTNHKPRLSDDYATWRRVKLIPFNKTITNIDNNLNSKLREEFPGILRWAINGCLKWQSMGLGSAKEVDDATSQYREEEDVLGSFINENCVVGDHQSISSSILYAKYLSCIKASSERHITQKEFVRAMQNRGFIKDMRTYGPEKGKMFWKGIGIKGGIEEDESVGGYSYE